MSFMDSYKRLEKLCSEVYNDNHGLSSYIDEMKNNPIGARYVPGWNEDLKRLKHYHRVRNQIVHEPDCTEENMCEPADAQWLNNFHSRIMSTSDPLALYSKARNSQPTYTSQPRNPTLTKPGNPPPTSAGCLTCIMNVLLAIIAAVWIVAGI